MDAVQYLVMLLGFNSSLRKIRQRHFMSVFQEHCSNLVIAKSYKVTAIMCLFFQDSPKRTSLLKEITVSACIQDRSRRKVILDLCETRWSMRQEAYNKFYFYCESFVKSLLIISITWNMILKMIGILVQKQKTMDTQCDLYIQLFNYLFVYL